MPAIVPFIPAIISAGGAVASTAIAKKKGKTQKQMEQMQLDLTRQAAQRQTQLQPVHDSILRAYAAMTSPSGSDLGVQTQKALAGGTPGTTSGYYDNPQKWWG